MNKTIFAKPGTSEQVIDLRENPVCPEGMIQMKSERPETGDWIAQADGTWQEVIATLDEVKAAKLYDINQWADKQLNAITHTYPQHEVISWDQQQIESKALLKDPTAETPLLTTLAENRGIDKTELANRVISKSNQFAMLSGQVFGTRQKLEDQLELAITTAEVEAIIVPG